MRTVQAVLAVVCAAVSVWYGLDWLNMPSPQNQMQKGQLSGAAILTLTTGAIALVLGFRAVTGKKV